MNNYAVLPEAKWIWPKYSMYLMNSYAGFRYDFEQESLPTSAPFIISADQSYKLHVNGRYVCRGPMRGQQENWHYDTVDLLPYLKKGHNWIAIEGHNPGVSTFSYHHKDAAGMICSANWDNGTKIFSNAKEWIAFRNTAYNHNTAHISSQLGKMEDLDLRFDDRSWILEEKDFSLPPEMPGMHCMEKQQGALPWYHLAPRPIAMLQEEYLVPERITSSGTGICAEQIKIAPGIIRNTVVEFVEQEMKSIIFDQETVSFSKDENNISFTIPAAGKGKFRILTLDLGALNWLPGVPVFDFENSEEGIIFDIFYHQSLKDEKIYYSHSPSDGSMVSLASRLHLGKKAGKVDLFQVMGIRYLSLIVRENTVPLSLKFAWRTAVYPIKISGNFSCADDVLNKIYDISVHTQKVCSMDAFVDTPWREQSQWWGDARVQAKNTIFLSGDTHLLSRGLRSIAEQKNPYGLTYANAPTKYSGQILPDFSLTWIITLRDLWFQTGKTDHFAELKDQADKIFAYFESVRDESGLIKYDKRFWLFEDWSPLPKQNTPAFINLWYIYTEELYLELLKISGYSSEAEQLRRKIEKEKTRAFEMFFDPAQQLFLPERDKEGKLTGTPSVHDQVLAILLKLAPKAEKAMIEKVILPCLNGTLEAGAQPSSFWATYLLDCAQECGLQNAALDYIRRMWSSMIPYGTVSETFVGRGHTEDSCSHAWSAHAISHLPELIFGLKQLSSGWEKIRLKPEFFFDANFRIPLPQGILSCQIKGTKENYSAEFDIPEGVIAEIILPDKTITASGEPVII